MMKLRLSLFSKIMLWFFLNIVILGIILFLIFNFRFDSPRSSFLRASSRIESVTRSFENEINEINDKAPVNYDAILKRYSETYGVEFFLFDNSGRQLGGNRTKLPDEIFNEITRPEAPFPDERQKGLPPFIDRRPEPPNRPPPLNYFKSTNPTAYWFVGRILIIDPVNPQPVRARLIAASDSFTGHGLFFDPTPFVAIAAIIIGFSMLIWFPFVRSITKAVGQMTRATEQIAEEQFDVRVGDNRTDELGRLGKSINHLAARLSGFVYGQKRFLGDISHELNSPLARMQFALSILEDRVDKKNRAYVEDVKEEVELMSKLVNELLTYSKTGIKATEINLERVRLLPIVENAVARETSNQKVEIELNIDEKTVVTAHTELLARALANVIRNAVRYAASMGKITISAKNAADNQVVITIADSGNGVPEAELEKLFDPFHRVESDRARQSGGSGLGLAIVKTCIESCRGKVFARNRAPQGFEVVITLQK